MGNITPTMILKTLKIAVGFCIPNLVFEAKGVSSHSLKFIGVMALLYSLVDSDIINLIGCWHSNKMLTYLHLQAEPLIRNSLRIMLTHDNYSFMPYH